MGTISSYSAATAITADDVFPGNDGATTKKFAATLFPTYVLNPTKTINNGETASFPYTALNAVTYQQNTDGTAGTSQPWNGVQSTVYCGNGGVAAIGTVSAGTFQVVIPGSGSNLNEYTSLFTVARSDIGTGYTQTIAPTGRVWGTDFNVHGPIAVQPNLLNGISQFINNYYNGSPGDTASAGMWISTKVGAGGGRDATHQAATTYAVDVGLGIVGSASGTGAGFTTGIKIGGTGSGWSVTASKIGTGINVADYATYGIRISAKHSSAAASVPALTVANGQGRVGIGIEAPTAPLEVKATDDTTVTFLITQVASQTQNPLQILNSGAGLVFALGPNGTAWSGGGSSAFPNYSQWSDQNSGLYLDTGDVIGLATNGIARLQMTVNGITLFNGGTNDLGGGTGVIGIHNAATVPTTNATLGGVLYCEAGALKYRGSAGTVTTLGAA